MALGARPAVRLTVRESDDVQGDVAFLDTVVDLLRAYPGRDTLVMNVTTLAGECHVLLWKVEACPALRLALATLLRAQAMGRANGPGHPRATPRP